MQVRIRIGWSDYVIEAAATEIDTINKVLSKLHSVTHVKIKDQSDGYKYVDCVANEPENVTVSMSNSKPLSKQSTYDCLLYVAPKEEA